MLEVGPDRQAAGQPGHRHLAAQHVGDVEGGRLAGGGRVGREDDLGDAPALDPPPQLADLQVFGVDAVKFSLPVAVTRMSSSIRTPMSWNASGMSSPVRM